VVSIMDEQQRGAALGAAAYLVKPVGRGALLDAIARVVPSVQTGSRAVGEG
jgi:CheY-like chemotaxis protein